MLAAINVGELDTRLRIEKATITNHAVSNQDVKTWAELKTIWVKELPTRSGESFEGVQQVAKDEVRFFARAGSVKAFLTADNTYITADSTHFTADMLNAFVKLIDEKMRVIRRGEIFKISGIEDSGRRGWVIMRTVRRDNE
jgi:head-tail adaptor